LLLSYTSEIAGTEKKRIRQWGSRFLRETPVAPNVAFVVSNLKRVRYLSCEQRQHRGFVAGFQAVRFVGGAVIASPASLLSKRRE
jgi:hypothetical protein